MSLDNVDMSVVNQAYATAHQLGADNTTMLALFEAGLVESGFRNLKVATDHDSLGYLQQRPSQGWPDPTNVVTATTSFVKKAMAKLAANPSLSAGQLAQSVQVSAYPERYAQREADARTLISRTMHTGPALPPITDGGGDTKTDGLVGAIMSAADALGTMAGGAVNVGGLATTLMKLALPSNVMRMVLGGAGIVFIFMGIMTLGREVKNG